MKLSQDVALGLFFVVIGTTAGLIALSYPFGTASRMGPGFFPVIIAALLTLTGIGALVRAHLASSPALEEIRWRPVIIVPAAIVVFGLLIEKLGLPLVVLLLVLGAATASVKFELSWKATLGAAAFSAVCAFVFVELLGLPIPLVGAWLPSFG